MKGVTRIARFLARAAIACALVYAASLLLADRAMRLLAAAAAGVLRLVDRPTVLTSLDGSFHGIVISTCLSGAERPLTTWDATSLPIFVVATLGLALAVPARDAVQRIETVLVALLVSGVVMVATVALQVEVTATNAARAQLGLLLHDRRREAFLGTANEGIGVAMLLAPAAVFAFAYLRARASRAAAGRLGSAQRRENRGLVRLLPLVVASALAAVGLFTLVHLGGMETDPRPGLRRIVALNPGAPQAYFALAYHDAEAGMTRR